MSQIKKYVLTGMQEVLVFDTSAASRRETRMAVPAILDRGVTTASRRDTGPDWRQLETAW